MRTTIRLATALALVAAATLWLPLNAQDIKVDPSKEIVGKTPTTFEPMVGTWIVAQDCPDKVIKVDGSPWKAAQDNPTRLLIESARRLYGTSNEELMDNAKQFAHFPMAVLKSVGFSDARVAALRFMIVGLVLMALVVFRPQGLFGKREELTLRAR